MTTEFVTKVQALEQVKVNGVRALMDSDMERIEVATLSPRAGYSFRDAERALEALGFRMAPFRVAAPAGVVGTLEMADMKALIIDPSATID